MARALACLACALALLAVPGAAAKRPRCSLKGVNLAHSHKIKVVRRTNADAETVRLLGCVKPGGRVRTLAEGVQADTTRTALTLDRVDGTWVVIRSSTDNQYGGSASVTTADVRTGRSYAVATESYMLGEPYRGEGAAALAVNSRGFTAAMLNDLAPSSRVETVTQRRVELFDSHGMARELDSGPPGDLDPASLILDTHTVLWAHGGLTRYARF
jgi:hypothetical protein